MPMNVYGDEVLYPMFTLEECDLDCLERVRRYLKGEYEDEDEEEGSEEEGDDGGDCRGFCCDEDQEEPCDKELVRIVVRKRKKKVRYKKVSLYERETTANLNRREDPLCRYPRNVVVRGLRKITQEEEDEKFRNAFTVRANEDKPEKPSGANYATMFAETKKLVIREIVYQTVKSLSYRALSKQEIYDLKHRNFRYTRSGLLEIFSKFK